MLFSAKAGSAKQFRQQLETTTIRAFEGGLNLVDTDLNMKPKYATVLDNLERDLDGTLSLRPGTVLLTTIPSAAPVINTYYFNSYIVAVTSDGLLWKVLADGTTTKMQIGAVDPWSGATGSVTYVSFAIFNSDLIICCGVHKPLIIPGKTANVLYNTLQYLVDLASLSNVNTPVGTLVVSHAQYTVIAGIPAAPSVISISARGTSGTFLSDPAPNDAVEVDLGLRVSLGSGDITGLVSYRDKLLVTFERGVLPINLGVYVGSPAVHTPTDDGFIEEFGCLAHRTLISVGDDTFYLDNIGVNSIQRVVLYNTLRPARASQLIDPAITTAVQALTAAQIAQYVFAVYDMRHKRYMLFIPVFDDSGVLTETTCYSYTSIPTLKIEAWARLRGWKFSSGCRTGLQNIVFSRENILYSYNFDPSGDPSGDTHADFVGDLNANPDGTGVAIDFSWELPWADFNARMIKKRSTHLSLDTTGYASFTGKMYVDNIRYDRDDADAPMLTTDFQAGSVAGYGVQHYGATVFGGGRPTSDERLFAWPCDFKIMKLAFTGSTKKSLKFISLSLSYLKFTVRR
jgi:hypothetical protein